MDKLKLTGQNLGRVFHSRLGCTCIGHAIVHITKQPKLKLKTRPKKLGGSLPLAFALPEQMFLCQIATLSNYKRTILNSGKRLNSARDWELRCAKGCTAWESDP